MSITLDDFLASLPEGQRKAIEKRGEELIAELALRRHVDCCRNAAIAGSLLACAVVAYIRYGPPLKGQDATFAVLMLFAGLSLVGFGMVCAAIPVIGRLLQMKLEEIGYDRKVTDLAKEYRMPEGCVREMLAFERGETRGDIVDVFHEGDKSKADCETCKRVVTTNFEHRTLKLTTPDISVPNVLVAVCEACGEIAAIPYQSTLLGKIGN